MKKLLERKGFKAVGVVRNDKSAQQLKGWGASEEQIVQGDILREGGEAVLQRALKGADALVSDFLSTSICKHVSGTLVCWKRWTTLPLDALAAVLFALSAGMLPPGHRHIGRPKNQAVLARPRLPGQADRQAGRATAVHVQGCARLLSVTLLNICWLAACPENQHKCAPLTATRLCPAT
jgi:hypothetical protein